MKFTMNVGTPDRAIRIIVGCALIWLGYSATLTAGLVTAAYVAGAIAIVTGFISFCPAYILLGINTRPKEP